MARPKTEEAPIKDPQQPETPIVEVVQDVATIRDIFHHPIIGGGVVRQLKMRRALTRPLISMSKRKSLAVECTSDIFLMELPLLGRGGGLAATRVFEGKELIPTDKGFVDGDECLVVCHEIMCSALHKAGFASMDVNRVEGALPEYVPQEGRSLKGVLLGFLAGDLVDGKRYRQISVAELE